MQIKDKTYDVLKWLCMAGLSGLATFIILLGDTWGIPYTQQIAATLTGLAAMIGTWIGFSTAKYSEEDGTYDGEPLIEIYESQKTEGEVRQ